MKTLNNKDFNLIEDFISGNLSPDENKKFRERLNTDENLDKAYHFRTKIAQYWNDAESYEKTKRHVKELFKKEHKRKKKFVTFIYAAASVIILIGISIFYLQQIKLTNSNSILTDTGKDTSSVSTLSTNTQPEKGTKYIIPPEYTNQDSLIIYRTKDFKVVEKIHIISMANDKVLKELTIEAGADSILISLKGLKSGSYRWVIVGTAFSGNFNIKERPDKNNYKKD